MEHHHDERLVDVVYLLNLYPGEKRTTWELDNLRSYLLFQGFLYYVFIVHNVHHVYRAYRLYVLHNIYVYICMCVYIVYDVYIIYNIYIYDPGLRFPNPPPPPTPPQCDDPVHTTHCSNDYNMAASLLL